MLKFLVLCAFVASVLGASLPKSPLLDEEWEGRIVGGFIASTGQVRKFLIFGKLFKIFFLVSSSSEFEVNCE